MRRLRRSDRMGVLVGGEARRLAAIGGPPSGGVACWGDRETERRKKEGVTGAIGFPYRKVAERQLLASTESGTRIASVILATTVTNFSTGSALPSGYPSAHATPALVVAIAFAPISSNIRALPASQAFGRMSKLGGLWRSRNVLAKFDITFCFFRFLLIESKPLMRQLVNS